MLFRSLLREYIDLTLKSPKFDKVFRSLCRRVDIEYDWLCMRLSIPLRSTQYRFRLYRYPFDLMPNPRFYGLVINVAVCVIVARIFHTSGEELWRSNPGAFLIYFLFALANFLNIVATIRLARQKN